MKVFSSRKSSRKQGERALASSRRKRGISLSNEREEVKMKTDQSSLSVKKNAQNKSLLIDKFIIYGMNREQWQRSRLERSLQLKTDNFQASPIKMLSNHSVTTERTSICKLDQRSSMLGAEFYSHAGADPTTQQERRQRDRIGEMQNRMKLIEKRLQSLKKAYCQ